MTLEFAGNLIEEETGLPFAAPPKNGAVNSEEQTEPQAETEASQDSVSEGAPTGDPSGNEEAGKRLIARDDKSNPLFSAFDWTADAIARVLRVPTGFMRDRTQGRIEELAEERQCREIDLGLVETGIELGLEMMADMVAESRPRADAASEKARGELPPEGARCPAVQEKVAKKAQPGPQLAPLNEVSRLGELDAMRMLLTRNQDSPEE